MGERAVNKDDSNTDDVADDLTEEVAEAVQQQGEIDASKVVRGTPGSLLFSFGIWVAVLYAVVEAFGFRPSARILPLLAGIPTLVVATVMVGREFAWFRQRRRDPGSAVQRDSRAELVSIAWFGAYTIGVFVVGFAISSPIFMVLFLRLYGRQSWPRILTLTIIVVGLTAGVFDRFFNIGVYEGWLFTL